MRLAIGAGSVLAILVALGIASVNPFAFQKVASVTDDPLPTFAPPHAVRIGPIIRGIPDRGPEGTADVVYVVRPAERYQRSIVEGLGNCSNMVKALAWSLLRNGYEVEIVHLLPIGGFLEGEGHTMLRAKLALPEGDRIGVVDVSAAGIPRARGRALDADEFVSETSPVTLDPLRPESEDWSRFYTPAFRSTSVVGRISGADSDRWFHFLEMAHLDIGLPEKIDKILYVGVGVVIGVYPLIHVADLGVLREREPGTFLAMRAALWALRIAPFALLGCALWWLVDRVRGPAVARETSAFLLPDEAP